MKILKKWKTKISINGKLIKEKIYIKIENKKTKMMDASINF